MASWIYLNKSVWSSPLVEYNIKQNEATLEERPDHAMRSGTAISKLLLGHAFLKKKKKNEKKKEEQKQGEMQFFEIFFIYIFLNFLAKL